MTKLLVALYISLIAGCIQHTATKTADSKQADLPKLQGEWVAVSHELIGHQVMFEDEYEPYKLSISGDDVDETIGAKTIHAKVEVETPNLITFVTGNRASWGVYKFDGDKLVITWAVGKNIEPTESKKATFVMERVQK